jgi:aspartate/methionine/tyrosine aminotransferase
MLTSTNTWLERLALESTINLSDAHCRTAPQESVRNCLSSFAVYADKASLLGQRKAEDFFVERFFEFQNISAARNCIISYSSSCLVLSLATVLSEFSDRVFFETPSFDNIRDLVSRSGCRLSYVSEGEFRDMKQESGFYGSVIWITNPNNPTGHVYTEDEILIIADFCLKNSCLLVIDACFRSFFSGCRTLDYVKVFANFNGLKWLVIEDTGKYLPLNDLKVGFLYCSQNILQKIDNVNKELLLNVSPTLLFFLGDCYARLDKAQYESIISANRRALLEETDKYPELCRCLSFEKTVPLLWFKGASIDFGVSFYKRLASKSVHILPGTTFFQDASIGNSYFRVALNRDEHIFQLGCKKIAETLAEMANN